MEEKRKDDAIFVGLMVWFIISLAIAAYVMWGIFIPPETLTDAQAIASIYVVALLILTIWFVPPGTLVLLNDWRESRQKIGRGGASEDASS